MEYSRLLLAKLRNVLASDSEKPSSDDSLGIVLLLCTIICPNNLFIGIFHLAISNLYGF